MPEIGTSGSMSEDGKRSDWQSLKHRAFPRLYTLGGWFWIPGSPPCGGAPE